MEWNLTTISQYPGDLWDTWDRLNNQYNQGHPLLNSRFVSALTKYFPADIEVLYGESQGECSALLLMEKGSHIKQRAYLPSQSPIALALLPDVLTPQDHPFQSQTKKLAWQVNCYALDPLYHRALLDLPFVRTTTKNEDITVDLNGTFADYWSSRSKGLRKRMANYEKKLKADLGPYTFKVISEADAMSLAVARYGMLESRGWKGKAGTSLHPGNDQGQFYADIMTTFASTGQAIATELWANDQLLASRLCLYNDHLFIVLKTTFDEHFKKFSVGRIHLQETIRVAFDNALSEKIDFYTNASSDQMAWATGSKPMFVASVYRGWPGRLLKWASIGKQKWTDSRAKPEISE